MIKTLKLRIHGVKGTETQDNGRVNIFNKILAETSLNLVKDMDFKILEPFVIPNIYNWNRNSSFKIIVKWLGHRKIILKP